MEEAIRHPRWSHNNTSPSTASAFPFHQVTRLGASRSSLGPVLLQANGLGLDAFQVPQHGDEQLQRLSHALCVAATDDVKARGSSRSNPPSNCPNS